MGKDDTLFASVLSLNILDDYVYNIIYKHIYSDDTINNKFVTNDLKLLIARYLIQALKEKIIDKPKNDTYKSKLLSENIDDLADTIATKREDGTYVIGSYVFKDAEDVVAKLRNKFAHSDYVLCRQADGLYINFDKIYEKVETDKIISFVCKLYTMSLNYKKAKTYNKSLVISAYGSSRHSLYTFNINNLNDLLDNYELLTINVESKQGDIPQRMYDLIDSFLNQVYKTAKYYRDTRNQELIDKCKRDISYNVDYINQKIEEEGLNCNFSIEYKRLSDEEKEVVKDIANKSMDLNNIEVRVKIEIGRIVERVLDEKGHTINTIGQSLALLHIIDMIEKTSNSDIRNILSSSIYGITKLRLDHDTLGIIQFLKIFSLSYLVENFDFDYSLFNLDNLKPSLLIDDTSRLDELNKELNGKRKNEEKLYSTLANKEIQLNNMEAARNISPEKIELVKTLINAAKVRIEENAAAISELSSRITNIELFNTNNSKYVYNYQIIERLRDSLAHGNVYIIPKGELMDAEVVFKDFDERGTQVFELEVPIKVLRETLNGIYTVLLDQTQKIRTK